MEQYKIDRINFLARKSRREELTPEEKKEQAKLRQEYRDSFVRSLTSQIDKKYGSKHTVTRKNGGNHNE